MLVRSIQGITVAVEGGHYLFTRKGYLIVARILEEIETNPGDNIIPEDGDKVVKGEAVITRKNKK